MENNDEVEGEEKTSLEQSRESNDKEESGGFFMLQLIGFNSNYGL